MTDISDSAAVAEQIVRAAEAIVTRADVTSPAAVRAVVDATLKAFGRIDILVNNAAISSTIEVRPFYEIPSDEWDKVMTVNARDVRVCQGSRAADARARYGKIINITSTTVFKGVTGVMHYRLEGAIIAMTRVMARELGPDNICVNCIAPD